MIDGFRHLFLNSLTCSIAPFSTASSAKMMGHLVVGVAGDIAVGGPGEEVDGKAD